MEDIKNLSDTELLSHTHKAVQHEREAIMTVLRSFQEIENRRLHVARGYGSMHEFCVKELGYDDGCAHRRIAASRLLKELPILEKKIENGTVSLTVASQAHRFFKAEAKKNKPYAIEAKEDLIKALEGKSTRQTEKILAKISPGSLPKERVRQVTENAIELKYVVDSKLYEKLKYVKGLLSNKSPHLTQAELLNEIVNLAIQSLEKKTFRKQTSNGRSSQVEPLMQTSAPKLIESSSRYISAKTKRAVLMRDKYTCAFVDPETKRKCESKHQLQFDHVIPYAKGGRSEEKNLRLLCKNHNIFEAIREYGREKISKAMVKN